MIGIDIDTIITMLRIAATVFTAAALVCLARVGPGWLAGGLCAVLAALAVTINVASMTRLDTTAVQWVGAHGSRAWHVEASAAFDYLGQPVHFAVLVVFCATLLALQARSATRGVLVVAVVGTGLVVEQTLKAMIGRTAEPLAHYSHAFPSGHVTVWAAFLGMVAVCMGIGRALSMKVALSAAVLAAVLAVGFLAVYSGAHIVTDIMGGMVLGGAVVGLGAAVLRASVPRARFSRAADLAAAISTHTAPLRAEDIALSRGY